MADGDSGIEGEITEYSKEETPTETQENGATENHDEVQEDEPATNAVTEQEPEGDDEEDSDRPVIELFVKVTNLGMWMSYLGAVSRCPLPIFIGVAAK